MTRRASAQPANFEAATTELERIVADMESGQLTLEQSLASYQRGAELLQFCQTALNAAQQQVQILENGTLNNFNSPNSQDDN
ncbi:exodeoxyribonuclease VII small subunit [Sulfuriferula nivalis]|uniref:Exodeoxyribonuclease 7 small subunit n=1 Tax=Sulfuriferula nivalis TaxID=2675298 RepID=A0A809S910_9PROT|nr:exodeoxyribonuclease VII small subunit [Sulfuriferula nivalis]BBP00923.1 exodeoxyribonuclease 7 small subunit [Sulfuriferula nivalis]